MGNEAEETMHPKRGRTPQKIPAGPETRVPLAGRVRSGLATLQRKYLHADLTPDDLIPEPSPSGIRYEKPAEFLRAGRAARVAELTFRSLLLLLNVGVITGVLVLTATGVLWRAGALATILALAALVFSVWIALSTQAYVRWMARNWRIRHAQPQPQET